MGFGHFQVNKLYTRKLEALPPAYTLPKQDYYSMIMAKNTNVSE